MNNENNASKCFNGKFLHIIFPIMVNISGLRDGDGVNDYGLLPTVFMHI